MKRNRYFLLSLLLILTVLLSGLSGCVNDPNKPQAKPAPTAPVIAPATQPSPDPKPEPQPAPDPAPRPSEDIEQPDDDEVKPIRLEPAHEFYVDSSGPPPDFSSPKKTNEKGVLLYNIPDSMQVNKREVVDVRISRSLRVEALKRLSDRLPADAQPQLDTITTGEIMDIDLTEPDTAHPKFRIIPQQNREQILDTNDIGAWSWSVTPLVAGNHALIVRAGIRQYSEKFQREGYRYIPVWEKEITVESNGQIRAAKQPADIPVSYDGPARRIIGDGLEIPSNKSKFPPSLIGGIIGAIVTVLVVFFLMKRSKKPVFVKPPPIPKEKLDAIDELIKKDKLETALDALETLVIVVRDKEHNQLIAYQAELESFEKKYKAGEIKYEDYSRVRARIRTALIEMNDRLTEGE